MATGTVSMSTFEASDPETLADALNAFFVTNPIRIFDTLANTAKASAGDADAFQLRLLHEDLPVGGTGSEYFAAVFQGSVSEVVAGYEATFVSPFFPEYLIDLTDLNSGNSPTMILLVIYVNITIDPAEGHHPNQVILARPTGVIAAGATGTIEYLSADGTVLGTATARNVDPATAATADEVGYAIMDRNSNEIIFLPSCCGAP